MNKLVNAAAAALLLTLFILLLHFGKPLLIPFALAIVIWYIILTIMSAIKQLPWIGTKVPDWLAQILAIGIGLSACWLIVNLITNNLTNLIGLLPRYQDRFFVLKANFMELLGITESPNLEEIFGPLNIMSIVSALASTVADLGTNIVIILIYLIFLLLEHHSFDLKLSKIIQDPSKLEQTRATLLKVSKKIQSYFKIKIVTSLGTALLSYIVMSIVGLDFAEFWALMIFLFNFIPNIGSIVATIFPCLLALLQFDTLGPFFTILIGLSTIQFSIGNFIEPKIMGRSFNLSPLFVILSLSVWGYLWGLVGMFLCVPIMVIMSIIFSQFRSTEPIAALLSESGLIE